MSEGATREELNPYARLTPHPKDILSNTTCEGFIVRSTSFLCCMSFTVCKLFCCLLIG